MTISPRPAEFTVTGAPDGVEIMLDAFKDSNGNPWQESRPIITPRLQLVHTNGAQGEGSIESAIGWGNGSPYARTHAHYHVDRARAAKLVPTNRRGIGNATVKANRGDYGNVSDWSIVIETTDPGYPDPGEDVGFVGTQAEQIAQILAYESILHAIPLEYPGEWHSTGTACHTEPFGYPYWTTARGKICPGRTKKQEMRDVVLPRAREIADAWTETTTPEEQPVRIINHTTARAAFYPDGTIVSDDLFAVLKDEPGFELVDSDHEEFLMLALEKLGTWGAYQMGRRSAG